MHTTIVGMLWERRSKSGLELTPTTRTQLQRLCMLRTLGIVAAVIALVIARYAFDVVLSYEALSIALGVVGIVTGVTWLRSRKSTSISELELFFHLLFDVIALFAILYLSGGSTNPFVSFLLFPLIITASLLPAAYSWLMAVFTVAVYSLLMFWYVPLTNGHQPMSGHEMAPDFRLHIIGMWVTFVVSALLISTVAVRMMASIRHRDNLLAAAREENLRNEKIIAVGTLAAGAAHELGTPLSTIAILCREMQGNQDASPQDAKNLDIIRAQVEQCKQSLSVLLANADSSRPVAGSSLPLDQQIHRIIKKWTLLRPNQQIKSLTLKNDNQLPMPDIYFDQTLDQALINLLNNAADASPDNIEVELKWDQRDISIQFRDLGPGLSPEVLERAGKMIFTTKSSGQGLGIGLYLANATIERFGGSVQLYNQDGGGALIQVNLPIAGVSEARL